MKKFNVRVYGILIKDRQVLISDEFINGRAISKFPGGGLEFGEGTIDCVIREFKEELDLNIDVESHFYTTDFFVVSAFSKESQVISIYYIVKALEEMRFATTHRKFDFDRKEGAQSFRWLRLDEISEKDFTFDIDKKVAQLLNNAKL
jgi:ADP-ribose pyrophosphatase YjhB (NUDIX family)